MSFKKIMAVAMTAGMLLSFTQMSSFAASSYEGWRKDNQKGVWRYYTASDGYVSDSWLTIGNTKYYFDDWGYMLCNIDNYCIDGRYYDFSSSGACKNPEGREPVKSGWFKRVVGDMARGGCSNKWSYYKTNGELAKNEWMYIGGKWYYFNNDGYCYDNNSACNLKGEFYFFNSNGEMFDGPGWVKGDSGWHYAAAGGKLYTDKWLYSGGKWYYFNHYAEMICDVRNYMIKGIAYNFDSSGACLNPDATENTDKITGWYETSDEFGNSQWRYYDSDGTPCKGWKKIGGKWYYFYNLGEMRTNRVQDQGKNYYFNENGQMQTGWYKRYDTYTQTYRWRYSGPDGVAYENKWVKSGGNWYFMDPNGFMVAGVENYDIVTKSSGPNECYSFDANGICLNPYKASEPTTGWFKVTRYRAIFEEVWYYYGSDGEMYKDKWLTENGKKYYFGSDGVMKCDTLSSVKIDGKLYDFDENGVCMNPNGRTTSAYES